MENDGRCSVMGYGVELSDDLFPHQACLTGFLQFRREIVSGWLDYRFPQDLELVPPALVPSQFPKQKMLSINSLGLTF